MNLHVRSFTVDLPGSPAEYVSGWADTFWSNCLQTKNNPTKQDSAAGFSLTLSAPSADMICARPSSCCPSDVRYCLDVFLASGSHDFLNHKLPHRSRLPCGKTVIPILIFYTPFGPAEEANSVARELVPYEASRV